MRGFEMLLTQRVRVTALTPSSRATCCRSLASCMILFNRSRQVGAVSTSVPFILLQLIIAALAGYVNYARYYTSTNLERLAYAIGEAKERQKALWLVPEGTALEPIISELLNCALIQPHIGSKKSL